MNLLPPDPFSAGAASNSRSRRPRNAVLGWVVVAALAIALLPAISLLYVDPLTAIICVVLLSGLVISRLRRGEFRRGWLLTTWIAGFLIAFGALGAAVGPDGVVGAPEGAGTTLLPPAVIALIAWIRAKLGPTDA